MDEENKVEEIKYPLEKLRENSKELFGVNISVFDGALYGYEGEFSKEEVKQIIKEWLDRPITQ